MEVGREGPEQRDAEQKSAARQRHECEGEMHVGAVRERRRHQGFGLGAGRQHLRGHPQGHGPELSASQQVRDRNPLDRAPLHQRAKARALGGLDGLIEIDVDAQPLQP